MSTEAPVLEIPPVEAIPPQPEPPKPSESLLSSIRVIRPDLPGEPPKEELKVETPKVEEPPKEEPKTELPKIETPKEPTDDPTKGMSEPAAKRFKKIEQRATEAEKKQEEYRTQLESVRKEHAELQEQLREVEAMRREYDQMKEESTTLREEIRKVNIERDPEFQRQYNGQILARQKQMLDMAVASGTSQADFVTAINTGDEEALEAIRDSLPAPRQRIWDAHRTDIERLAFEKREAIQDSQKTWEGLEQTRLRSQKELAEQMKAENVSMAKKTVDSLWKSNEVFDKAGLEVKHEMEEWMVNTIVNESRENIAHHLLIGKIAQNVVEGQKTEIERLTSELDKQTKEMEEMKEKLGEQETFIKEVSSRTPRPSGGGNPSPSENNGSLLSSVRIRLPGR